MSSSELNAIHFIINCQLLQEQRTVLAMHLLVDTVASLVHSVEIGERCTDGVAIIQFSTTPVTVNITVRQHEKPFFDLVEYGCLFHTREPQTADVDLFGSLVSDALEKECRGNLLFRDKR